MTGSQLGDQRAMTLQNSISEMLISSQSFLSVSFNPTLSFYVFVGVQKTISEVLISL